MTPIQLWVGTGTASASIVSHSSARISYKGKCTINAYLVACTGIGDQFWFY
ncbi:hypothetical protein [uncultured Psychroserpens sp.]|uniref:hypothetical protein n=1 Tax=uncultured Psychroserpens sp. TaxID=255436 RepID=UPI002633D652|nr:hypothetical protein [uncultured Psychroserpens sp.]